MAKLSKGNTVFLLNPKIHLFPICGLESLSDSSFRRFIYLNLLGFSIDSVVGRLIFVLGNYLAVLVRGILLVNIRAGEP